MDSIRIVNEEEATFIGLTLLEAYAGLPSYREPATIRQIVARALLAAVS